MINTTDLDQLQNLIEKLKTTNSTNEKKDV